MKICQTCGRPKHKGICDMVELDDGQVVHSSRVAEGGDLEGKRIRNRWIKRDMIKPKPRRFGIRR